jgi:hypothetical protein
MKQPARLVQAAIALGMVLVFPTYIYGLIYSATAKLESQLERLDESLKRAVTVLGEITIFCASTPDSMRGYRDPVWEALAPVANADSDIGRNAFSAHHEDMVWIQHIELPGTFALLTTYPFWMELGEYLNGFRYGKPICRDSEHLSGDDLIREEERTKALVRNHQATLSQFVPRLAAVRQVVGSEVPKLRIIAWTLRVLVCAGIAGLVSLWLGRSRGRPQ